MQQSMQATRTGSGRREERVPLEARIELRTDDDSEPRKADGLNVSVGGLAMRAATVPPLGATVACRFSCPPGDEPITVRGEVVWALPAGGAPGSFGVRFVELDTKSATSLRRYVGPHGPLADAPERLRSATIRIDGLGPSVEAELKLADETRVVLEQELSFLQLGRAVEVSVQGRGTERGRIASVELRQSHRGGPTIVYGVLLDGAPAREVEATVAAAAPLFMSRPALTESAEVPIAARLSMEPRALNGSKVAPPSGIQTVGARVAISPRPPRTSPDAWGAASLSPEHESAPESAQAAPASATSSDLHAAARAPRGLAHASSVAPRPRETVPAAPAPPGELLAEAEPSQSAAVAASTMRAPAEPAASPRDDASDDEARALHALEDAQQQEDEQEDDEDTVYDLRPRRRSSAAATLRGLPLQVGLLTRALGARLRALTARVESAPGEQADGLDLPDGKTRMLLHIARVRGFLLAAWSWLQGLVQGAASGASSRPPLRMQRATLPGVGPAEGSRFEASRRVRIIAGVIALVGVGLGVYALLPDPSADRIEVPEPVVPAAAQASAEPEEPIVLEIDQAPPAAPEPKPTAKRRGPKALKSAERAPDEPVVSHAIDDPEGTSAALDSLNSPQERGAIEAIDGELGAPAGSFGDAEVPNGRTFTLRMNGPVKQLAGQGREHGFTVRIPGRVAVDRASPIATAHNAVSRAMILNKPGYAELTVEFRPGVVPRYQVRGKDNTLEVTLERL